MTYLGTTKTTTLLTSRNFLRFLHTHNYEMETNSLTPDTLIVEEQTCYLHHRQKC